MLKYSNRCLKVPTGGGKTFLACNAIKPIFDGLPSTKTKVVVWLVPSDSILSQTMNALKSSSHPYRQKINADFNSTGLENIKWWHRNISRRGFCINAYINHYPDFIVMTKTGKIVLIETKGDHLENTETKQKLAVGRAWQNLAGPMYKYYMVFQSKDLNIEGAYQFDKFLDILKNL